MKSCHEGSKKVSQNDWLLFSCLFVSQGNSGGTSCETKRHCASKMRTRVKEKDCRKRPRGTGLCRSIILSGIQLPVNAVAAADFDIRREQKWKIYAKC